ncbi:MAG TPA: alpha/beta fold hydrolase [Planctomycetota bacterium]|nr:alpha/beta fold hydrolase [Planctomycetota bacterium]
MKTVWLAFPWLATGCVSTLASSARLTAFREQLFEEGALRDVHVDGRRYCVVEVGKGPPLILLHGLGGSIYDWRHLLRPLSRSHRVIVVDLLGSGESEIPTFEDYSIAAQARRVKGLMDVLGVERGCIVGNSYGGGIALKLVQDWPERVDRLVLINSICYPEHIPTYVTLAGAPCAESIAESLPLGKMTRWVLRNSYHTVEKLTDEELESYILELRTPGRRRALIQILRAVVPPDSTEFEARIKSIQAPVLLLWGTADETIPVSLGRRLQKDLPHARMVELDAGHVPNQECPRDVLRWMEGFLDGR